jgi:hypothetical protein
MSNAEARARAAEECLAKAGLLLIMNQDGTDCMLVRLFPEPPGSTVPPTQ